MTPDYAALAQQTFDKLQAINRDTAARYQSISVDLPSRLSVAEYEQFSRMCLSIADTGWRSFESVNLLVEIATLIDDPKRLLAIGHIGLQLSGYSFEPSLSYFQLVVRLIELDRTSDLPRIERGGLALHEQYHHASGLISGYFKAAVFVVSYADRADLNYWINVTVALLAVSRENLSTYLGQSALMKDVSWDLVSRLHRQSAQGALSYLAHLESFHQSIPAELVDEANGLLVRHASSDVEGLIKALEGLKIYSTAECAVVLAQSQLIKDCSVLIAFLHHARHLPLHRPGIVREWLQKGLDETANNRPGAIAYVSHESTGSVDRIRHLQGQVTFADHRRTFDLLAEALTARKMNIETIEVASDFRSDADQVALPNADGKVLWLPASVNLFDEQSDNFGFYKVSLFHQLGYVEFGCFKSIAEVARTLDAFENSKLAERIFLINEDARIDWQLAHRYVGIKPQLNRQKSKAASVRNKRLFTRRAQLLEALILSSLDHPYESKVAAENWPDAALIWQSLITLQQESATVIDTLGVTRVCYEVINDMSRAGQPGSMAAIDNPVDELLESIAYRGEIDVETVESTLKIEALIEELEEQLELMPDQDAEVSMPATEQDQIEPGDLVKGDVTEGVAMLLAELENVLDDVPGEIDPGDKAGLLEFLGGISSRTKDSTRHIYDEWDYQIRDYRSNWCTLLEHRDLVEDEDYVRKTLVEHQDLSRRIRQQLNRVRPEMLRKVKGVAEGEELDLERTIAYVVDRKAGCTPDENIYIQRQRKERDVSTLFLLDMSASTDDIIPDADAQPIEPLDIDDDEYLIDFFRQQKELEGKARRIIDLEKQSVVLMAEALEKLGDAYSVCGFSGYGREQVDYYLCKDFDDAFDARSKGRIGGIKPSRSTRMGPPIRHATRRLIETGSRIKALIIISDGYPQDHDYGTDRNSREYGLMDTMKALSEAKQQGVLTYCLTVDPSGHDYLRAMCPDSQYMIIQDIDQLPEELSRVYRSLTG